MELLFESRSASSGSSEWYRAAFMTTLYVSKWTTQHINAGLHGLFAEKKKRPLKVCFIIYCKGNQRPQRVGWGEGEEGV